MESTGLTALLKHHVPEKKMHARSVKWSESNDEAETAKKSAEKLDIDHTTNDIENGLEELPKYISVATSTEIYTDAQLDAHPN